ncbi:MAG: hypothetical protein COB53_06570 [Elusimicrobia bacterium]|nr:MAG: hypothetical protein COB53_06570 [Elusimicrobiota bacterium]
MREILFLLLMLGTGAEAAQTNRGVLEGFYGRPWSWSARRSMVRWMGKNGFNLFVLAPKDDWAHRLRWRDPLTREYFEGLSSLMAEAKIAGVRVAWGLQPRGAGWEKGIEVRAAVNKIVGVVDHGVDEIVLAFDDLEPNRKHFLFANRVREALMARTDRPLQWTFVPAVYWGEGVGGKYWEDLKRDLHPSFRVAWTGPQILSRSISERDALVFSKRAERSVVMGDNFPVQDRLIDGGRLFLGPVSGREGGAIGVHTAWVSNATPLAEASKASLYSVGEFLRDPDAYDPCAVMRRSAHRLGGKRAANRLGIFIRENAASWLAGGADPGCGKRLADVLRPYRPGRDASEVLKRLREAAQLPTRLRQDLRFQPALRRELAPWLRKFGDEATAAAAAVELFNEGVSQRRKALLERRFRLSKHRADNNRAIVADQEITRFLSRLDAYKRGEQPQSVVPLNERLRAAAAGEIGSPLLSVALGQYEGLARHELVPWLEALEMEVGRVRARLERRRGLSDRRWRWKIRWGFLPLIASKTLMDAHFAEAEKGWVARPQQARVPFILKIWLLWRSWTQPQSLTARLWGSLARYGQTGDASDLKRVFNELSVLPLVMRERHRGRIPVEVLPWIDRVGDYGLLGLKSIRLAALYRQGIGAHWVERRDWALLRERVASGNGLEMALETKHHLDAFGRWALTPAADRSARLDLTLPVNPADVL